MCYVCFQLHTITLLRRSNLMVFFEEYKKQDTKTSQFDKDCASQLKQGLIQSNRYQLKSQPTKWADSFRLLREKDQKPEEVIECVLEWYLDNLKGRYTPRVRSGDSFRTKFPQLLDAYERGNAKDPTLVLSQQAEKIVKRLRINYKWHGASDSQLDFFVQQGLDGYCGFLEGIKTIKTNLKLKHPKLEKKSGRYFRMIDHLIGKLPSPDHFISTWFEDCARALERKKQTSLDNFKFQIESIVFQNYILKIVHDYGRDVEDGLWLFAQVKKL